MGTQTKVFGELWRRDGCKAAANAGGWPQSTCAKLCFKMPRPTETAITLGWIKFKFIVEEYFYNKKKKNTWKKRVILVHLKEMSPSKTQLLQLEGLAPQGSPSRLLKLSRNTLNHPKSTYARLLHKWSHSIPVLLCLYFVCQARISYKLIQPQLCSLLLTPGLHPLCHILLLRHTTDNPLKNPRFLRPTFSLGSI